jgi:hypothetical protein
MLPVSLTCMAGLAGPATLGQGHSREAVSGTRSLCVGHVRQLGGASPLCNLMEVKH